MFRIILCLTLTGCFLFPAAAQNFRVQVAAFADSVPASYFRDRGLNGVLAATDANGVYRYFFGSYPTRIDAEHVQKQLIAKGFANACIIDLEEQRVLSTDAGCPYFLGGPEYDASEDSVRVFLFELGQATLNEKARADLDWAYQIMQKNPNLELRILGYTDAVGSGKANVDLATARARAARNYLIDKGLRADRMLLRVFGESAAVKIEGDIENEVELEEARRRFRCVLIALVEKKN